MARAIYLPQAADVVGMEMEFVVADRRRPTVHHNFDIHRTHLVVVGGAAAGRCYITIASSDGSRHLSGILVH